jgi:Ca-activated chloride channel homolog
VINRRKSYQVGSRTWVSLLLCLLALVTAFVGSDYISTADAQDGRPRRSSQQVSAPTVTSAQSPGATAIPTPKPSATPTPAPTQTPVNQQPSRPTASPRPTPPVKTIQDLGEPPPPAPIPTPTPPEQYGEGEIVKVNTDLITLNVRVIDRNNRPIAHLNQNDFHVYEEGVEQPIEFFTQEEVPIGYGLAVDTSGSLRSQLQSVIDAGKTIVNSNKPGDETFVIRFIDSEKIELKQDFTASKDLLIDTLDEFYIEGGQTAIIDAVYLAAEHAGEYKKGDDNDRRRRALILITDGEDRGSRYSQAQLFARLREADVQIYVIGFVNELDKEGSFIRKSSRDKAVNLINKLATETGGRAFFPQSISELPQIANEIVRDMRTQYVVAYNPTNKTRDGSYRAIRVTVSDSPARDKRIALTRSGRTAPTGPAPVNAPKAPTVRLPGGQKSANKTP